MARIHLLRDHQVLIHAPAVNLLWTRSANLPGGGGTRPLPLPLDRALAVCPLRSGNLLSAHDRPDRAVLEEWTPRSQLVAESALPRKTQRLRACLEELQIGLDHPRPAAFDRNATAFRIEELRTAEPAARRHAAAALGRLGGRGRAAVPALVDLVRPGEARPDHPSCAWRH
jgi:hypothetical protein